MEAKAHLKYLRITPRKVRFVADLIRRLPISEAEAQLMLNTRRGAGHVLKLLRSAKANALQKKMDAKKLYVSEIRVDEGPKLKRYNPRARGSVAEIQKKMSHVTIVLSESERAKGREFILPKKEKKSEKKKKDDKKRSKKAPSAGKQDKQESSEKETTKPKAGMLAGGKEKGTRRFFRRKSI